MHTKIIIACCVCTSIIFLCQPYCFCRTVPANFLNKPGAHPDTVKLPVSLLGTSYLIGDTTVFSKYPFAFFKNFTIKDTAGNALVINGNPDYTGTKLPRVNLVLQAKNFLLLNTSKAIANQLYGFAKADINLALKGKFTAPSISGDIVFNDSTNVSIILPQSNENKAAEKKILKFVNIDSFLSAQKQIVRPRVQQTLPVNELRFINRKLNIIANNKTTLHLIIDPSSGDELILNGNAHLNAGLGSTGNILLAGKYLLDTGAYVLNYQFLKKQFNILKGSGIVFNGAMSASAMNIKAVFNINTSAKDLIGNESSEPDQYIRADFKKDVAFKVLLFLKGSVIKPAVSFDIELADTNAFISNDMLVAVQRKIRDLRQDADAINKQVFSLLTFGRFVGEQSTDFFNSSSAGTINPFSNLPTESVSRFLITALQNVAVDIFKGLDVEMDNDSYRDFGSGDVQQKAEANFGATKSFINNRITLNTGKNYWISGDDASARAARQKGSFFLPDVTLTYQFSESGKYFFTSYKQTPFEVVLDGFVVESGVGFLATMDYKKFSNIINGKDKKATPQK